MTDARDVAASESRSPGLHHSAVPNPIGMGQSMYMQMKPLDLGIAERNRIIHDSHSGSNHVGMLQSPYADIKTKPSTSPRLPSYDNRDLSLNLAPKMRRMSPHAVDQQFDKVSIPRIITTSEATIVANDTRLMEPIERYSVLSLNAKKLAHRMADPRDIVDKYPTNCNSYGSNENCTVNDSRQLSGNNSNHTTTTTTTITTITNNKNMDATNNLTSDVDNNTSNHNSIENTDNEDNNNNHSNSVAKTDSSRINDNESKSIDNGSTRANSQCNDDRLSKSSDDANAAKEPNDNLAMLGASSNTLRTNSADGLLRSSSSNSSPAPSPCSVQSAPATPAKLPTECDKPTSPGKLTRFVGRSDPILRML